MNFILLEQRQASTNRNIAKITNESVAKTATIKITHIKNNNFYAAYLYFCPAIMH